MIGEMISQPEMKKIIARCTRIVTFFNSSHYWGGQLNNEAKKAGNKRALQKHTETRWYSLILQALSVKSYRYVLISLTGHVTNNLLLFSAPLTQICTRDDAQRRVGGFSPVNADIIDTVLDCQFWDMLDQLVRSTKPIVDAIGNLESRQATLADCMLELI